MNIHPFVVHFPIACLLLYSIIEIVRVPFVRKNIAWFYIKLFLLVVGSIGAFVAVQTGGVFREMFAESPAEFQKVINTHEEFGEFSMYLFLVLALIYVVRWVERDFSPESGFKKFLQFPLIRKIWAFLRGLQKIFFRPWLLIPMSIIGMISLAVTGALGGAMVYGPDVDPMVSFIYNLLF